MPKQPPDYLRSRPWSMFWRHLRAVTRKELWYIRRDPIQVLFTFIFPMILLLSVGNVLDKPIKSLPLAVVDTANDRISETLISLLSDASFLVKPAATLDEALLWVQIGQVNGALEIPAGALQQARESKPLKLTLYLDGSDPDLGGRILIIVGGVVERLIGKLLVGRSFPNMKIDLPVDLGSVFLFNPDQRPVYQFIPGFVGLILTTVATMLTALAIVRERESGTLEMLISTPIKPFALVIGKTIPYFLLSLLVASLITVEAIWIFDLPFLGQAWLLIVAILLFVLGSLGLGILISTLTRTQFQAMFAIIAYLFPSIFLSGLIFSIDGVNRFFQLLSYAVPLRYFIDIARGVLLRDASFASLRPDFFALFIFVVLMFLGATLRFRKTLN